MKNRKALIALTAGFIVLLGGAYFLYGWLSEKVENEMPGIQALTESSETEEIETESVDAAGNGGPTTDGVSGQNSEDANMGVTDTDAENEAGSASETTTAPDFTVVDADGNAVNLSDFFGKPIVLNFWASWCGPCKSEMPEFEEAYAAYGEDVQFLMVNMTDGSRETVEVAQEFIAEQGYTFPVYFDTEMDAAITYSVMSIPCSYFIDAKGNLIARASGAIDAQTLQTGIDMIFVEE